MKPPKLAFSVEPSPWAYRLRLARYQGLAESLAHFVQSSQFPHNLPVRLLDVGVGNGRTLRYCETQGVAGRFEFHGIDNSPRRLADVYGGSRWRLRLGDVEKGLDYGAESFDVVVCEQVLEHVVSPRNVLEDMIRVLSPGGLLVVGVPIFTPVLAYLRRTLVPAIDRCLGIQRGHVQAFTLGSIRNLLESVGGVSIQEARGFRILSGGPLRFLENHHWWYRLNRHLGKRLPSLCVEAQLLAIKTAPDVSGRASPLSPAA